MTFIKHPNGPIIFDSGTDRGSPPDSYGGRYSLSHVYGPDILLLHPNLKHTTSEWRGGGRPSTTGFVNTSLLAKMHGNPTDPEGVRHYERKLLNGEGYESPIHVAYNVASQTATVSDGNHRLKAAHNLGLSHVPATLVRVSEPQISNVKDGRYAGTIPFESEEEWPFTESNGKPYITPTMHPRWVMNRSLVLPEYSQ